MSTQTTGEFTLLEKGTSAGRRSRKALRLDQTAGLPKEGSLAVCVTRMPRRLRPLFLRWAAAGAAAMACFLSPVPAVAAPTTPVVTDDGTYTTSTTTLHATWTSSDPQSGIAQYQYLIRQDSTLSGTIIINWTSTGTTASVTRTGLSLLQGKQYYFQVKAKNGAGLWSATGSSNGIRVDKTAPSPVTVTDDGATTASTTQLHATWSASADAESGVVNYQYLIRQDSTVGTIIVNYTSLGVATQVTRTGLSLISGKTYYIGVRAKNGAGLYSSTSYSDGIAVSSDIIPPTGSISINGGAAYTNTVSVTLSISAMDNNGPVTQMQFSNDKVTYTAPEAYATTKAWTLSTGDGTKTVYVKYKDAAGNWSAPAAATITLDTTPPSVQITSPADGSIITGP